MLPAGPAASSRSICGSPFNSQSLGIGRFPRRLVLTVQAVASPASVMKVYEARTMTEAQLQEFTARPRIDFASILETVSLERMGREPMINALLLQLGVVWFS